MKTPFEQLVQNIADRSDQRSTTGVANDYALPMEARHNPDAILASIREVLAKLRDTDPIASYLKRTHDIDVKTHDVYMHEQHRAVWTNPPSYIKFTHLVAIDQLLAVQRDMLQPLSFDQLQPGFGSNLWTTFHVSRDIGDKK